MENLKTLVAYLIDTFWNQIVIFDNFTSINALKAKYEYRENCKVRGSVNAVDPRKRIDECALEKEEKDYFNEDSDEEDSTSAQSSHIRKQEAQPISNRIRFSLRPIPGRLVDYDDDDDEVSLKILL